MPALFKRRYRSYYYDRKRKSGGIFGLLVFLVVAAVLGFLAWQLLPALGQSRLDKFDRFNVVISGAHTALVSLDLVGSDAVVVQLPDDLYMAQVAHGYGQYKISKVYAVGRLDRRGGEVLEQTVANFLGIPVDGYIRTERQFQPANLKPFSLSLDFLVKDQGSLGLLDKGKLVREILSLRFDRIKSVNLGDFADSLVLADGSTALSVDQDRVDAILKDQFVEKRIGQENLRVAVVNSTKVVGLGNKAARVLSNLGAAVVSVDSAEPTVSSCRLTVPDKLRNSETTLRIADIFHCRMESMVSSTKADLVVVLGQDFANLFQK